MNKSDAAIIVGGGIIDENKAVKTCNKIGEWILEVTNEQVRP